MRLRELRWFVGSVFAAAMLLPGAARAVEPQDPRDWPMYQHDIRRSGYNPAETKINRTSAALLRLKWIFNAGDAITASPVVAHFQDFDLEAPGEQPRKVVYVGSADEKFYALDAADGTKIWEFQADPAPGIAYNMFVSSGFVDKERGVVYVGGGYTMYALDLYDGTVHWRFTTAWGNASDGNGSGHGCPGGPQPWLGGGEIESSPVMVDGVVYFGSDMDGRDSCTAAAAQFPAVWAVDADMGSLKWYWRPSTRSGCGDVWASVAVDPSEGLLYFDTSDCTRSDQQLYNEAIIALDIAPPSGHVAGTERTDKPNWYYQPRLVDPYDYDFGSTPLLFDLPDPQNPSGPPLKKFLGVGGKDGVYYVIERQRAEVADTFRPASGSTGWQTRVVRGGFAGGFIGSSATDGTRIWGATALFDTPTESQSTFITPNPLVQPPFLHAFNATTGAVEWQQVVSGPTFAATTAVPGVVFVGNTAGTISAIDAETGQLLWVTPAIGAVSSGAAVSDGEIFIGGGTTADSYGLGQGPLNAVHAFALVAPQDEIDGFPPQLPPQPWPLGVVQHPDPPFPDETEPNPGP